MPEPERFGGMFMLPSSRPPPFSTLSYGKFFAFCWSQGRRQRAEAHFHARPSALTPGQHAAQVGLHRSPILRTNIYIIALNNYQ